MHFITGSGFVKSNEDRVNHMLFVQDLILFGIRPGKHLLIKKIYMKQTICMNCVGRKSKCSEFLKLFIRKERDSAMIHNKIQIFSDFY